MDLQTLDSQDKLLVVGNKFVLKERLGGGSFGQIYAGINHENSYPVAIKLEKRIPNQYTTLGRETRIMSDLIGETGFPSIYHYGKEEQFCFMVISLLGLNLEKLYKICGLRLSLKTILMLADQMISRIEALHSKNYVHRDIKPENFVMGSGQNSKVLYMIDFGLARAYSDSNGKHISFKDGKGLVGTARYASLHTHNGIEQSRRDDLESIGYTLIYLMKGSLPWQNLRATTKEDKYTKIAESKAKTSLEELCEGLPSAFQEYMDYVKKLEFTEKPNYKYLKKIFRKLFVESGFDFDYDYDWVKILSQRPSIDSSQKYNKLKESRGVKEIQENLKKLGFNKQDYQIKSNASTEPKKSDRDEQSTKKLYGKPEQIRPSKEQQQLPKFEMQIKKLNKSNQSDENNGDDNDGEEAQGNKGFKKLKTLGCNDKEKKKKKKSQKENYENINMDNKDSSSGNSSKMNHVTMRIKKGDIDDDDIPQNYSIQQGSNRQNGTICFQKKPTMQGSNLSALRQQPSDDLESSQKSVKQLRRRSKTMTPKRNLEDFQEDKDIQIPIPAVPKKSQYAKTEGNRKKKIDSSESSENLDYEDITEWNSGITLSIMMKGILLEPQGIKWEIQIFIRHITKKIKTMLFVIGEATEVVNGVKKSTSCFQINI